MRALLLLTLPLLFLACRRAEVAPEPPRTVQEPAAPGAAPAVAPQAAPAVTPAAATAPPAVDVVADTGVEVPPAMAAEFQEAWTEELRARELPRLQGARVRLFVKRYRPRPPANRFLTLGVPGLASTGAGLAMLASRSGGAGMADLAPTVVGSLLVGGGLVFLTLGIVLGGHQAHLNKQRGYALQQFKATATLERVVQGHRERWRETYTHLDLSDAAPLPPEAARDPARVRREMMRALARQVHQDLEERFR